MNALKYLGLCNGKLVITISALAVTAQNARSKFPGIRPAIPKVCELVFPQTLMAQSTFRTCQGSVLQGARRQLNEYTYVTNSSHPEG